MKIFSLFLCLAILIILILLIINCFKGDSFKTVSSNRTDGFGHNMHYLIAIIGGHNLRYNVNFKHLIKFYNNNHNFEHIDKKKSIECNIFIRNFLNLIINKKNIKFIDKNDNIEYLKHPFLDKDVMNNFLNYYNFNDFKHLYIKSNYILKKYSEIITIHCRFGDSGDRKSNYDEINSLIFKLNNKYTNSLIIIHTDGDKNKINNKLSNLIIKGKETHILNTLYDILNSTIFVTSFSSLSTVGVWLGNHKLIIIGPSKRENIHPYKKTNIIDYKLLI
jgi:hypothetical protein